MTPNRKHRRNDEIESEVIPAVIAELGRIDSQKIKSDLARSTAAGQNLITNGIKALPAWKPLISYLSDQWTRPIEEIAYAAGFIDGEACISAVRQTYRDRDCPSIRIRIDVVQNDREMLCELQKILNCGGNLNPITRQPCHRRQCYVLSYDGSRAVVALLKIRKFLRRKRPEADACIQLFHDGKLSRLYGPRGVPPEIRSIREFWVTRIQGLK